MAPLGFILLLGMTTPQQSSNASQPGLASRIPNSSFVQSPQTYYFSADRVLRSDTCFAIRSYVFKRKDGNAPVLARTTTCTSAEMLRREEVSRRPGRLVPLD